MKRMKRGIAGFLAALVLFFSVLGASVVVVPPVEVQANPLSAVYYAVEALMGLSGLVTGNSDDVNRLQELFSNWITNAGDAYSSAQENWDKLNQQVDVGSGISIRDRLVKAWKDFIAGDAADNFITNDNPIASSSLPNVYFGYDFSNVYSSNFITKASKIIASGDWVALSINIGGTPTDYRYDLYYSPSFTIDNFVYVDSHTTSGYVVRPYSSSGRISCISIYTWPDEKDTVFGGHVSVIANFYPSSCYIYLNPVYELQIDDTFEKSKIGYGGKSADVDDTKDLTITPDTSAPTISQQVADAIAANPGITRDELNDIVDNAIRAITDAEAVVTPTPEPEDPTHDGTILGILTAIFALLKTIATACTNFSVNIVKEVTSAMASWVKLWIDAFTSGEWATAISSFLSAIAKSIDDYLPGVADKLAALAKGIDNWQTAWAEKIATIGKAIDGFKEDVKTGVLSLGDRVMTGFRDLADVIQDLIDISAGIAGTVAGTLLSWLVNIATNIGTIADFIADILTVPITWVKSIVDAIAQAAIDVGAKIIALPGIIIDFFTIDVPAIKIAALAITAPWDNLFDPIKKLAVPLQGLSFSDNYNYPCYKMETPPVLKQFYKHDYIVLIDFEDYATYMLTVRLVVRASIWLGFAYYIIRHHMNVNFHIG